MLIPDIGGGRDTGGVIGGGIPMGGKKPKRAEAKLNGKKIKTLNI